jgi:hypothetical protein
MAKGIHHSPFRSKSSSNQANEQSIGLSAVAKTPAGYGFTRLDLVLSFIFT